MGGLTGFYVYAIKGGMQACGATINPALIPARDQPCYDEFVSPGQGPGGPPEDVRLEHLAEPPLLGAAQAKALVLGGDGDPQRLLFAPAVERQSDDRDATSSKGKYP
ncbi:hypothetical protein GCM10009609_45000 [Pseudonocardia aurantiaca]|uniref:Uncharacterized protein n=1 Tax=Pseudonocardia aurantiaca TaxID=75290 RepID=A0ABW4FHS3_9PSEU